MSADIIQFIPRPNPKADRAFWIGPEPTWHEFKVGNETFDLLDTAPAEYVAPQKDPA